MAKWNRRASFPPRYFNLQPDKYGVNPIISFKFRVSSPTSAQHGFLLQELLPQAPPPCPPRNNLSPQRKPTAYLHLHPAWIGNFVFQIQAVLMPKLRCQMTLL